MLSVLIVMYKFLFSVIYHKDSFYCPSESTTPRWRPANDQVGGGGGGGGGNPRKFYEM